MFLPGNKDPGCCCSVSSDDWDVRTRPGWPLGTYARWSERRFHLRGKTGTGHSAKINKINKKRIKLRRVIASLCFLFSWPCLLPCRPGDFSPVLSLQDGRTTSLLQPYCWPRTPTDSRCVRCMADEVGQKTETRHSHLLEWYLCPGRWPCRRASGLFLSDPVSKKKREDCMTSYVWIVYAWWLFSNL